MSPGVLGLDERDPRLWRNMAMVLNVYQAAQKRRAWQRSEKGRKKAKGEKPRRWDADNPEEARLLRWARGGQSAQPDPLEVRVDVPVRPAGYD